ncbi:MAG TPA: hypothetical protein VJL28_02890 [Gemmatimonadaceae bacterium]|nr:hypothetical protein [Gemmatimonadaceae bacterium]
MRPLFAASARRAAACVVAALAVPVVTARAQQWNDARTMALVDLAIARRAAQLADTGLADYRANAHGFLTFLAQLGEGFPDPPKVVRTDELALEVYWRAPNQSKQRIVGRRDTLLLPTDIAYHRDHLAIVQNNFPSVIRLGEGDEVLDVPHPLSAAGRAAYDYAVTDSLLIRTSDRAFDVLEVKVRPRDDRLPRTVGAVYLDRASAAVVRMTLSFTRAALRDPQLEDVSIILDNGLVDGRFWLPRRQEVEIRRAGTWLDFPARGIIRGRWEICCVQVNIGLQPPLFEGPEVVAVPLAQQRAYRFPGGIVESLPRDVRLGEADDVRRVQEEARALVREQALARARRTVLTARAVSDLVRMNRVEGVALGAGVARPLGGGLRAQLRLRYGFADRALKESASLAWERPGGVGLALVVRDDFREAGDEPEASGLKNSLAAQEFASDFTDAYRARGVALTADAGGHTGVRWRLSLARERQDPLAVHARAVRGAFQPAFPAQPLAETRASLEGSRADGPGPFGSTLRVFGSIAASRARLEQGRLAGQSVSFARASLIANLERPFGADRLVLHVTSAAVEGRGAPEQAHVLFGGPITGPGYDYHELRASAGVSERLEWRHPVTSIPLSLGRFGRLRMPVTLAPFAHVIWVDRLGAGREQRGGWFPAAGVGVLTLFDLLRLDVARGLRGGRWTFALDLSREFWRIL